ncbi:MAG TPA: hypothetical protein VHJ16_05100 [Xanthobacteraceae bacterium]|jgi:hypothetical protein|nr:hypothetical protein [Xanthobacteraceae bacterium]
MLDRDTVIALHESGHAVIARALALRCGAATVADGRGRADYEDEAGDGSLATIIAHMAGGAAEHVQLAASPTASLATGSRSCRHALRAA